jgi:ABC-type amino acid transport system permease subunit
MASPESALLVQQAIQLSVAPVFLLTGIAGLLGVMANRLARIIDRAREVGGRKGSLDAAAVGLARVELTSLERRRHLASWAINFCTGAALLVCTVIVTLFIEEFLGANLKWLAGAQFIAAMLAVIAGLSCFLAEVYIATHASHIDVLAFEA